MYTINKYLKPISFLIILLIASFTGHTQAISDSDMKKNIAVIGSPLQSIIKLQPRIFEYNTDKYKTLHLKQGVQYGFLANNMQEVFPGMVSTKTVSYMFGKNTYRDSQIHTIDEAKLIPVLVASIQELHSEIELLKMEIQKLRK